MRHITLLSVEPFPEGRYRSNPASLLFHYLSKTALFFYLTFLISCTTPPTSSSWQRALPDCPCRNPDAEGVVLDDGWAKDRGDIGKYHAGATVCYRSYPATPTEEGRSGQQCCYDREGRLITVGSGAGTPDRVSTCRGEDEQGVMRTRLWGFIGHYFRDVVPWNKAGGDADAWREYNQHWSPNNGNGCPENEVIAN